MRGALLLALFTAVAATRLNSRTGGGIQAVVADLKKAISDNNDEGKRNAKAKAVYDCYSNDARAENQEALDNAIAKIEECKALIEKNQGIYGKNSQMKADGAAGMKQADDDKSAAEKAESDAKDAYETKKGELEDGIGRLGQAVTELQAVGADQTSAAGEHADYSFLAKDKSMAVVHKALRAHGMKANQISLLQERIAPTFSSKAGGVFGILDNMKDTMEADLKTANDEANTREQTHANYIQNNRETHEAMKTQKANAEKEMAKAAKATQDAMECKENNENTRDESQKFLDNLAKEDAFQSAQFSKSQSNLATATSALQQAIAILDSDDVFNKSRKHPSSFLQLGGARKGAFQKVINALNNDIEKINAEADADEKRHDELATATQEKEQTRDQADNDADTAKGAAETAKSTADTARQDMNTARTDLGNVRNIMAEDLDSRTEENATFKANSADRADIIEALQDALKTLNAVSDLSGTWTDSNNIGRTDTEIEQKGSKVFINSPDNNFAEPYELEFDSENGERRVKGGGFGTWTISSDGNTLTQGTRELKKKVVPMPDRGDNDSIKGSGGDVKSNQSQFGKSQGATTGIIATIENLIDDYRKQESDAADNEKKAQDSYDRDLAANEDKVLNLQKSINDERKTMQEQTDEMNSQLEIQANSESTSSDASAAIKSMSAELKFFVDNHDQRVANREKETAAIEKAIESMKNSPQYKNEQATIDSAAAAADAAKFKDADSENQAALEAAGEN